MSAANDVTMVDLTLKKALDAEAIEQEKKNMWRGWIYAVLFWLIVAVVTAAHTTPVEKAGVTKGRRQ